MYKSKFTKFLIALGVSASFGAVATALTCPSNDDIENAIDTLAKDGKATFGKEELSLVFFETTNNNYKNTLVKSSGELLQFVKTSRALTKDPTLKGRVSVLKLDTPPNYCPYKVTVGLNHVSIALSDKAGATATACPLLDAAGIDQLKQNGHVMVGQQKYTFSTVGSGENKNLITTKDGLAKLENKKSPLPATVKVTAMKNLANDGRCMYHISTTIGTTAGGTGLIALVPAS